MHLFWSWHKCSQAKSILTRNQTFVIKLLLGLPYLEKQKSGQRMATLHQAKFMGYSNILITKSGRSNSFVDLEGRAFKKYKKGVISKKKRSSPVWQHFSCDFHPFFLIFLQARPSRFCYKNNCHYVLLEKH